MKIILGTKRIDDVQILGKDGRDLTKELALTRVEVILEAGKIPRAVLHCNVWDGFCSDIDWDNVAAKVTHGYVMQKDETDGERSKD